MSIRKSSMVTDIALEPIIHCLSDSMIVTDPRGDILFFNDAAVQYEELTNKPLKKGRSLYEVVSPERKSHVQLWVDILNAQLISQTTEAEYRHPHGYSVFFKVNYTPIVSSEGQLEQICIVAHDVTSQKSQERKTSELLHDLSSVVENANALIFSVDGRGYITEWNKECGILTGYEKSEVLAAKAQILLNEREWSGLDDILAKVSSGQGVSNKEFNVQRKSGDTSTILFNITPKVNAHGRVVGATFMGQDITELSEYRRSLEKKVEIRTKKLSIALAKEQELVGIRNKFVSMASHEFKIPLSVIRATVLELQQRNSDLSDNMGKLETIDQQVTYMKAVLEDVLASGKASNAGIKAVYEPLNITVLLQKIIMEVVAATQCSHSVTTDFEFAPINVHGDEKLLRNIFINLLSNAIKFSPDQNEIHVSLTAVDGFVTTVIEDWGIGISDEDQERISEPFNRGMNTMNIAGTGLGLTIVRKAVHALDGEFTIESKLNEFTKCTVRLKVST